MTSRRTYESLARLYQRLRRQKHSLVRDQFVLLVSELHKQRLVTFSTDPAKEDAMMK